VVEKRGDRRMTVRRVWGFVLACLIGCATPQSKPLAPEVQEEAPRAVPSLPSAGLKEMPVLQVEREQKVPEKLYSLSARDSDIQEVLLSFSKESELNIVVDPDVTGKVTVDFKEVPLRDAFDYLLGPLNLVYVKKGLFVRVSKPRMETRFFTLNYVSTRRIGTRTVTASSGSSESSGSIEIPGTERGALGSARLSAGSEDRNLSSLATFDEADFWGEVQRELEAVVFGRPPEEGDGEGFSVGGHEAVMRADEEGRKLVINRMTGVIMVTDYPSKVREVADFLSSVQASVQRQVMIEAKIIEVILAKDYQMGVDWSFIQSLPRMTNLAWGLTDGKTTGFPGSTSGYLGTDSGDSDGGLQAGSIDTPGTFHLSPFGGVFAIGGAGSEVFLRDILDAISEQGDVNLLSSPRISTLNNQKAIIRVGDQDVFFVQGAVATESTVLQTTQPYTIDIGIVLDVTPQIGEDGMIIMNVHPSISDKTGEKTSPDGVTTFPILSVRETDTTIRVADGQTIIIAGLMREKKDRKVTGLPFLQSVPKLGPLFSHTSEISSKSELIIMLTPTIMEGPEIAQVTQRDMERLEAFPSEF
jgi:MSHA type pilus biogenesis protein MshL